MNEEFLDFLKKKTARGSVGPSTLHNMGPSGTIAAARHFLAEFDLSHVSKSVSAEDFKERLDAATNELKNALPVGGQHWGSARKCINIYFRDVLYNRYLCKSYGFEKIEPWLEIPLDSQVATELRQASKDLPRWGTVIGLSSGASEQYQQVANNVADFAGVARVHLDLKYHGTT